MVFKWVPLGRGHRVPVIHTRCFVHLWLQELASFGRVRETFLPRAPGPMRLPTTLNHWWIYVFFSFFSVKGNTLLTVECNLSFLLEKEGYWAGPRHIWVLVLTWFCHFYCGIVGEFFDLPGPRQRNISCCLRICLLCRLKEIIYARSNVCTNAYICPGRIKS